MPPSAAPEWLRTGWIVEMSATSAPASCASIAARMPAQPAPITRTSCFASTRFEATRIGVGGASGLVRRLGLEDPERPVGAVEPLGALDLRQGRRREPAPLAVALEDRAAEVLADEREPPCAHLPVHLLGGPARVDVGVVVVEQALVVAALLRLAPVAAREALEDDGEQFRRRRAQLRPERLVRIVVVE